jgi:hypothetical protein
VFLKARKVLSIVGFSTDSIGSKYMTLPDKDNSTTKSMNDIYITENGVIKLLKDLNPHKASGPDQIPTMYEISMGFSH